MTSPLLQRFVAEARDLLQGAATGLLALEKNPGDDKAINEVFRSVHTLKGSVGLFDFPAFTKLVHAGEDVLSAVRAGQLGLTSELVDLLLDSLDQVSSWIDEIDTSGTMPDGADGVSRDLSVALRAVLPADAGEAAHAEEPGAGELASLEWIADLPEAQRLTAFASALQGGALLAVEYIPADDCFFSGEDPLTLFRQFPDLYALAIDTTKPWPLADALDPYQCVLRFRALTGAPRAEIEHLFRYVVEQIKLAEVAPHQLASVAGDVNGGPVYEDFVDEARHLAECEDWAALGRSVGALLELSASGLLVASALRWLRAVLATPLPDRTWVAALIDCIATNEPDPHPLDAAEAPVAPAESASAANVALAAVVATPSPMFARILEGQRTLLEMAGTAGGLPGRLASVERTVANLLAAQGRQNDLAPWEAAVAVAGQNGTAVPAIALLNHWLESPAGPAMAAIVTSAPEAVAVEAIPAAEIGQADGYQRRRTDAVEHDGKHANRVLKVDQAKVDSLMNLIGELVVSKNSLPFLAKRAEEVHGSREMSREIKDTYAVIDRLAQEMQSSIMAVRMLPVSEVFDRFPRLVRDVARKLGKRIALVIEGEETAADKNIIEVLGDPLLHIIRNSIDHGIELPEDRDAIGKSPQATILVKAFQEGDQVAIEVSDDGRGIDPEKIKASALAKGIIDEDRAARLSDQDAVNLVFFPGFSTAEKVSDLSGRGVGMDVVVTTIEKAGGSVTITSLKGEGTTVRLSLPLSMAVTRVMVIEACGGMLFGIPMDHIAETVRVNRNVVQRIKTSEAFVLRDSVVPLIRLDTLLGVSAPLWFGDGDEEDAVLVVRLGGNLVGLVVDHFREGMDIILKPFDGILGAIQGYCGTALLGDGRVLLVLNLKELL
jgi:two-component system chemotaxis sensor kinase CheA